MEGRTKKERREAARLQREQILKAQARRSQLQRLILIGIGVAIVVVVIGLILLKPGSSGNAPAKATSLPGIQATPPPWQPEYAHLRQRLRELGLPATPSMSALALHDHDLLQIFEHGEALQVPALVGIDEQGGYLTSLHTHDATGVIHVESPTQRSFNLGEFFDVWGVRLTSTCIGGLCDSGQNQLRAYVDGKAWSGDPRSIPLKQHEDIVLTYGTSAEQPNPIPSDYSPKISKSCTPDC